MIDPIVPGNELGGGLIPEIGDSLPVSIEETPQSVLRWRFGGKEIAGQRVGASVSQSGSVSALAGTPAAAAGRPYLDFGARLYDPRTATWLSQDPLSEKYYPISPYAYCHNNPLSFIDPTGCEDWRLIGLGALFMIGGAGSLAAALGVEGSSAGTGSVLAGYLGVEGTIGFLSGLTLVMIGVTNNPSEDTDRISGLMPSGLTDFALELTSMALGNENESIRKTGSALNTVLGTTKFKFSPESTYEIISNIGAVSQVLVTVFQFMDNSSRSMVPSKKGFVLDGFNSEYDFLQWVRTNPDSWYNLRVDQ